MLGMSQRYWECSSSARDVFAAYEGIDVDWPKARLEVSIQQLTICIFWKIVSAGRERVHVGENLKSRWSTPCVVAKRPSQLRLRRGVALTTPCYTLFLHDLERTRLLHTLLQTALEIRPSAGGNPFSTRPAIIRSRKALVRSWYCVQKNKLQHFKL